MDPNHPLREVPRPRLPRILPDPSAFRLPPACVSKGAAREQQREATAGGSMVLSGRWAQTIAAAARSTFTDLLLLTISCRAASNA